MAIQKYKPMMCIQLKDGRKLYVEESKYEQFLVTIEKARFVTIGDITVNVYEIKTVEKSVFDYDLLENLTLSERNDFNIMTDRFKKNLNREPSRSEKEKFLKKITIQP